MQSTYSIHFVYMGTTYFNTVHANYCMRDNPCAVESFRLPYFYPTAEKVKACRGYALTGGQGDPSDVGPLLENVANEDQRSTVCDPTLAHRQAMGSSSLGHPFHGPLVGGSGGEREESVFFNWRSHPDRALWALVEQNRGALRGDCGAWHARKHGIGGSGDGGRGGKWPFAKLGDGCGLDCTLPGKIHSFAHALFCNNFS